MVNIFGYNMPDFAGRDYEKFEENKQKYLKERTSENSAAMKIAYAEIYEDFKLEMHRGTITEADFYRCKKLLNEGL